MFWEHFGDVLGGVWGGYVEGILGMCLGVTMLAHYRKNTHIDLITYASENPTVWKWRSEKKNGKDERNENGKV